MRSVETQLSRGGAGWILLAVVVGLYVSAYASHELFPGFGAEAASRGWWTWSDQSRYRAEASAIAELRLDRESFTYPLGYSVLAAPFVRLSPAHLFFLPNLLLVTGAAVLWWRLCRRWLPATGVVIAGAAFALFHRGLLADCWIVPWNTLVTQLTLWASIWTVHQRRGAHAVHGIAMLAAATYLVRPIDVVPLLPLGLLAVTRLRGWRDQAAHGLLAVATLALAVLAVGLLNRSVFGAWRSPYEVASTGAIGFFSYPVSYKLFWLLVDGRPLFLETAPALLFRYPWLFLAPAAVVFWWRRERFAGLAGAAAIGLSWFVYLNYNDFLPSDVYRFTLIHYLAWTFPLLFALSTAALLAARRDAVVRGALTVSALLVVVAIGLRMDERPLPTPQAAADGWSLPAQRPLLLRWKGTPAAMITELRLDGRPLVEYSEFLAPFVPSDLQCLLSERRDGRQLTAVGSMLPAPRLSEYVWRWRLNPGRIKRLCQ